MGAVKRLLIGSTSNHCLENAPCTVVVCKNPTGFHAAAKKEHVTAAYAAAAAREQQQEEQVASDNVDDDAKEATSSAALESIHALPDAEQLAKMRASLLGSDDDDSNHGDTNDEQEKHYTRVVKAPSPTPPLKPSEPVLGISHLTAEDERTLLEHNVPNISVVQWKPTWSQPNQ
jgi:hypothetical protein